MGADPSERHALLPGRLVLRFSAALRFSGAQSSAGERAYANPVCPAEADGVDYEGRLSDDAGQVGGTNEAGVGTQLGDP